MKPLLPNTYVLNNKYLQSIISPSTDIIDYNFSSDQIHKLNLLQILRPDIYFNKNLSDNEFFDLSKKYLIRFVPTNPAPPVITIFLALIKQLSINLNIYLCK